MTTFEFWFWLTAISLTVALCAWQSLGWWIARRFLYSDHRNFLVTQTPADRGINARKLRIELDGPHHLSAWLLSPSQKQSLHGACIVMVHGYDSGKDKVWSYPCDDGYRSSILDQGAESLWRAGFHVLAMDLRNHGESSCNGPVTLGARESDDVLATVEYLTQHADQLGIDPNRIGLRGESMGGATCLIAAAKDRHNRIAGVWVDSAYADAASAILDFLRYKNIPPLFGPPTRYWMVRMASVPLAQASPLDYVGHIDCPVFLTHSTGDTMLPCRHLHSLSDAPHWRRPPETWVLQSHQHNRLWREPDYHDRQIDFFRRVLCRNVPYRRSA
ncbi:MAG: alpha/beta fold hydrolase [Pirellulaceae bacterium]|nr:alpha/beta fold hydrolase [Pirellulaceae bacterium]